MIAPMEDRMCPSNTEKKEVANFCFHGPDSPLFSVKTQGTIAKTPDGSHGQRFVPQNTRCHLVILNKYLGCMISLHQTSHSPLM